MFYATANANWYKECVSLWTQRFSAKSVPPSNIEVQYLCLEPPRNATDVLFYLTIPFPPFTPLGSFNGTYLILHQEFLGEATVD